MFGNTRFGKRIAPVAGLLAGLCSFGVGPAPVHADAETPEVGTTIQFVSCPIYRDTDQGRKSGCWLTDDRTTHTRYDITWAQTKPQLGKAVLIEGVVTDEEDTCGGVVLKPLMLSVLPDYHCPKTIVPAGEYPGRAAPPPVAVSDPLSVARELPAPPYSEQEYNIFFELNRHFLRYQHAEVILEQIQLYALASDAKEILIQGYAATEPPMCGVKRRNLAEPLSLAKARADIVALSLQRLGVPDDIVRIEWFGTPDPSDDLEDGVLPESSKRRVTIKLTPGD